MMRIFISLFLFFLISPVFSDTIFLRSGEIFVGNIIKRSASEITVKLGTGEEKIIQKSQITKISKVDYPPKKIPQLKKAVELKKEEDTIDSSIIKVEEQKENSKKDKNQKKKKK